MAEIKDNLEIKELNLATGEETIRPMTAEEIQNYLDERAAVLSQMVKKENAKQSILNKLGITEEEAKLLLG